jgi:hypothetical protein
MRALLLSVLLCIHGLAVATDISSESLSELLKEAGKNTNKYNRRFAIMNSLPKEGTVLEIGIWKGDHSNLILNATQPLEMHLVDPWVFQKHLKLTWYGGKSGGNKLGQEGMNNIYASVLDRFKNHAEVHIHRNWSCVVPYLFENQKFDMIYIDGNHYIDGAFVDLHNSFPKLKVGGYLVGDDVDWLDAANQPAVLNALNIFLAVEKCVKSIGIYLDFVLQRIC